MVQCLIRDNCGGVGGYWLNASNLFVWAYKSTAEYFFVGGVGAGLMLEDGTPTDSNRGAMGVSPPPLTGVYSTHS